MPFIVTPEGKILAQSGAILKYICKKGGKQNYILQSFRFTPCKGVNPAWIFCKVDLLLNSVASLFADPLFSLQSPSDARDKI